MSPAGTIAAAAIIIGFCALGGSLARRARQSEIVGQLLAGIALGPSVLGHLSGPLYRAIFPQQVLAFVNVTAQLVLVLFLCTVGYELDLRPVLRHRRAVPLTALGAFALPLLLGAATAELLPRLLGTVSGPHVGHGAFVLFIAVALAITAVPVLAVILRERALAGEPAGVVAMASAGLLDAAGWIGLSIALLAAGGPGGGSRPGAETAALLLAYLAGMVGLVRPALRWWFARQLGAPAYAHTPVVAVIALGSAWVTSSLGLQVMFGAFVAGVVTPRLGSGAPDDELVRPLNEAGRVLLPLFFASGGMAVNLQRPRAADVLAFVLLLAAAAAGKVAGGHIGARAGGLDRHTSLLVGVLLNTRGLTELIALNAGLHARLIDQDLYSVLVAVAVVTTAATGPLAAALDRSPAVARARVARTAPGATS